MMLDVIELTGIEAYGYHGCLPQERIDGQMFYIDVKLYLDLSKAGCQDNLNLTVNYAAAADKIVALVSGEPVNLIETVAERLAKMLFEEYDLVQQLTVRVHKPQAPVPCKLHDLAVEITRQRR